MSEKLTSDDYRRLIEVETQVKYIVKEIDLQGMRMSDLETKVNECHKISVKMSENASILNIIADNYKESEKTKKYVKNTTIQKIIDKVIDLSIVAIIWLSATSFIEYFKR